MSPTSSDKPNLFCTTQICHECSLRPPLRRNFCGRSHTTNVIARRISNPRPAPGYHILPRAFSRSYSQIASRLHTDSRASIHSQHSALPLPPIKITALSTTYRSILTRRCPDEIPCGYRQRPSLQWFVLLTVWVPL